MAAHAGAGGPTPNGVLSRVWAKRHTVGLIPVLQEINTLLLSGKIEADMLERIGLDPRALQEALADAMESSSDDDDYGDYGIGGKSRGWRDRAQLRQQGPRHQRGRQRRQPSQGRDGAGNGGGLSRRRSSGRSVGGGSGRRVDGALRSCNGMATRVDLAKLSRKTTYMKITV